MDIDVVAVYLCDTKICITRDYVDSYDFIEFTNDILVKKYEHDRYDIFVEFIENALIKVSVFDKENKIDAFTYLYNGTYLIWDN